MRRTIAAIAVVPVMVLSLSACGAKDGTISGSETVTVEESGKNAAVSEEEISETEPAKTNPTFGDTYTWPNGLAVTIGEPQEATFVKEYTADLYDVSKGTLIAFDVTLYNGTDADFEALRISTQMISGNKQTDMVFSTEDGFDLPTVTVLPGNTLEWKIAYIVDDPADMQLSVTDMQDLSIKKVHFVN